jgi:hypothetical protein
LRTHIRFTRIAGLYAAMCISPGNREFWHDKEKEP